ncbi:MAG TPA: hypothetical protein VIK71_01135 [Flavobacteriales bacterium]
MSIITEAPSWFILLCLLAGVIYAGALYFRDRFNKTYGKPLATLLGLLRFASVALLAFFLLKPLIKSINRTVEKPVIVIAQDNSESLVVGKDSTYHKGVYKQQLQELLKQFGEDYDVHTYRFGNEVRQGIDSLDYSEKFTDFSNLLDEIYTTFSGRNLGAIVVASDGLYNKGSNPIYAYKKLNVPVYTVALGDTTVHKDVLLAEVSANRLAYLGNKFPIEITVEGRKAAGETATLTVSRKGNKLYSETIQFTGDRFFKTIPITLDAIEVGLQKYSIQLSSVSNEVTLANNYKDVFIDVLDSRQKVLILAHAPHPDLNAMRDAITSNESYNVDVQLAKDFSGNLHDYSLVIFHQLPGIGGTGASLVTNAMEKNIPSLFVWGASTDFNAFNRLNIGFSLEGYRNNLTDVSGSFAEEFSLFTLDNKTAHMVRTLPPLAMPFGNYGFSPGASTVIYQQVGQIKTKKPLIAFNKVNENKIGLIAGEGIWRWKLAAFQQTETHAHFNELITKMVQYLASKEDKSLFRVNGKNDFYENENIIFNAELYNQSYEPITNREIAMRIRNEEGTEYTYTFSPVDTRYRLDAGKLPVGNYTYEAQVNSDQGVLKEKGEFSISALQLEVVNSIADHRLLYQFAHDNNGDMVYPQQMNQLAEMIKAKKEIVSVSYENKQLSDLINYKWIMAFLIFLLGLEWLLRKRAGTY